MDISNLEEIQSGIEPKAYDGRPKEYKIKTLRVDFSLGMAATLKEYYAKNLATETGRIIVGKVVIEATPKVLAILKAVLYTGCCRIEERATACREVFTRACKAGPYIDTEALYATFVPTSNNQFVTILQETIRELLNE